MDTTIDNEGQTSLEKCPPEEHSEINLSPLTPPPEPLSPLSSNSSLSNGSHSKSSPSASSSDTSETAHSADEQEQVALIGNGLKSVTFNLPAQEAKLEEREMRLAVLEDRLKNEQEELESQRLELKKKTEEYENQKNEFDHKKEEWSKLYERQKQELLELEARATSAQGSLGRRSLGVENTQSNSEDRRSIALPRTIAEEEVDAPSSEAKAKPNTYEDDDFEIHSTPPRSFARQSIGQWSVERRKNNMSVKSLVGNFESAVNKRR